MHAYDITGGPGLARLLQSLVRYSRTGGNERYLAVAFTVPIRPSGAAQEGGGWIWDGSCEQVSVRITGLERIEPLPGQDSRSEDWRYTGAIDSLYKGLDGTRVSGVYSVATRTGTIAVTPPAQIANAAP